MIVKKNGCTIKFFYTIFFFGKMTKGKKKKRKNPQQGSIWGIKSQHRLQLRSKSVPKYHI